MRELTGSTNEPMRSLAEAFVDEPELIAACLEGISGEPPEAARQVLAVAKTGLEKSGHYADLCYYSAQAAYCAGELADAASLTQRALEINPRYRAARILAARVALLSDNWTTARRELELVIAEGGDYPDVHVMLGDACRHLGDRVAARRAYERALALNQQLRTARAGLAALNESATSGNTDELSA